MTNNILCLDNKFSTTKHLIKDETEENSINGNYKSRVVVTHVVFMYTTIYSCSILYDAFYYKHHGVKLSICLVFYVLPKLHLQST